MQPLFFLRNFTFSKIACFSLKEERVVSSVAEPKLDGTAVEDVIADYAVPLSGL